MLFRSRGSSHPQARTGFSHEFKKHIKSNITRVKYFFFIVILYHIILNFFCISLKPNKSSLVTCTNILNRFYRVFVKIIKNHLIFNLIIHGKYKFISSLPEILPGSVLTDFFFLIDF